jgi:outer membrane protein assembly factor BamE (lipoprotein component of BamABCDE complex)
MTALAGWLLPRGDIIRQSMKTRHKTFGATFGAAVTAALLLSGCAKDIEPRGNLPPPEALAKLAPGEQTRQDVQGILGTPATTAVFDNENWYYISGHTTQYAFYPNHELDRTIYVVSFDQRGILSNVRKLNLEDGMAVTPEGRATPTKGREVGILEQLLGNVGRIGGARQGAPGQ